MPVGPRGEKRPTSSVSSMVKAMSIAVGIEEEEYVEGSEKKSVVGADLDADESDEDELDEEESEDPEYEMAALEVDDDPET